MFASDDCLPQVRMYVVLQKVNTLIPCSKPLPMAVIPCALSGSLLTNSWRTAVDVTSVRFAIIAASVLKLTRPTYIPCGTTVNRKSAEA